MQRDELNDIYIGLLQLHIRLILHIAYTCEDCYSTMYIALKSYVMCVAFGLICDVHRICLKCDKQRMSVFRYLSHSRQCDVHRISLVGCCCWVSPYNFILMHLLDFSILH